MAHGGVWEMCFGDENEYLCMHSSLGYKSWSDVQFSPTKRCSIWNLKP